MIFGRLTVIEAAKPDKWSTHRYTCRCDCGNITTVSASKLQGGHTRSCGCLQKEIASKQKTKDITGQAFGRLTALYPTKKRDGNIVWLCRCIEGNEIEVPATKLLSGNTKSCGCLKRELAAQRAFRHGETINSNESSLYHRWQGMKNRCLNSRHKHFKNYGGRGITFAPEWIDYIPFRNYVHEHLGPRPKGWTLDRIHNDGNYEPGNLRWAPWSVQARNKRPPITLRRLLLESVDDLFDEIRIRDSLNAISPC
jgi:hypothetical protein